MILICRYSVSSTSKFFNVHSIIFDFYNSNNDDNIRSGVKSSEINSHIISDIFTSYNIKNYKDCVELMEPACLNIRDIVISEFNHNEIINDTNEAEVNFKIEDTCAELSTYVLEILAKDEILFSIIHLDESNDRKQQDKISYLNHHKSNLYGIKCKIYITKENLFIIPLKFIKTYFLIKNKMINNNKFDTSNDQYNITENIILRQRQDDICRKDIFTASNDLKNIKNLSIVIFNQFYYNLRKTNVTLDKETTIEDFTKIIDNYFYFIEYYINNHFIKNDFVSPNKGTTYYSLSNFDIMIQNFNYCIEQDKKDERNKKYDDSKLEEFCNKVYELNDKYLW